MDCQIKTTEMPSASVFTSLPLTRDVISAANALSVMIDKEQAVYRHSGYLQCIAGNTIEEDAITEEDRIKLADWCYTVVDHCQFNRETVAIAMEMVDRFLSSSQLVPVPPAQAAIDTILHSRREYQLLTMSALYTSIKIHERVTFDSDFFSSISRGAYSVHEIESMERILLLGLSWRVNAPTSIQMAHHILSLLLPYVDLEELSWGFLLDEVRFQTEHAVRDYQLFTVERASTVAIAAIFNALDQVNASDRVNLLSALLIVIQDFEFESTSVLNRAKNQLLRLVMDGDSNEGDDGDIGTADISMEVSNSDANVSTHPSQDSTDLSCKSSSTMSPSTSPITVTSTSCCSRRCDL
eukprot:g9608.t1 g9608   contig4:127357-128415(+)